MARDTDMKIYLLKTSELYMQLNKELIVKREIIEGGRGCTVSKWTKPR